jgi:hypothetical protein
MRELGYVEGQNIAYEFRPPKEGWIDSPKLAAELVRLKVDVIVALYVPCALSAKQATREIHIVIIAALAHSVNAIIEYLEAVERLDPQIVPEGGSLPM